jgi:hypothetical protein
MEDGEQLLLPSILYSQSSILASDPVRVPLCPPLAAA